MGGGPGTGRLQSWVVIHPLESIQVQPLDWNLWSFHVEESALLAAWCSAQC